MFTNINNVNGDYIMKMWEQKRNFKKFLDGAKDQDTKWKKKIEEIRI